MSAYIASCFPGRVEVLSDGAAYTADGVLRNTMRKIFEVPGLPAVIVTRGDVEFGDKVRAAMVRTFDLAGDFDGAIDGIEAILPALKGKEISPATAIEVVIAGISESAGPTICWWSSLPFEESREAFELYLTDQTLICGVTPEPARCDQIAALGGLSGRGVEFMESLRREKAVSPGQAVADHFVGGHIDHAIVTADGVTVKRLHTWPDQIGEKMGPVSGARNIVSINRQQRRAAERAARQRHATA